MPLLELGAGFDKQYTGRENIFLYGSMLGYSKKYLEEKYDAIVKFSGLKKFINVPIKNYSSGMRSKLGFSIATIAEPEILILDEVLSVGAMILEQGRIVAFGGIEEVSKIYTRMTEDAEDAEED